MRRAVSLLVLLSLAFAPAPFPRQERGGVACGDDLRKMQGDWLMVSRDGERVRERFVVTVRGDRMHFPDPKEEFVMTLDARTTPRRMRSVRVAPQDEADRVLKGIYDLEGDTLTIAFRQGETAKTPLSFDVDEGAFIEVYKRKKR